MPSEAIPEKSPESSAFKLRRDEDFRAIVAETLQGFDHRRLEQLDSFASEFGPGFRVEPAEQLNEAFRGYGEDWPIFVIRYYQNLFDVYVVWFRVFEA